MISNCFCARYQHIIYRMSLAAASDTEFLSTLFPLVLIADAFCFMFNKLYTCRF